MKLVYSAVSRQTYCDSLWSIILGYRVIRLLRIINWLCSGSGAEFIQVRMFTDFSPSSSTEEMLQHPQVDILCITRERYSGQSVPVPRFFSSSFPCASSVMRAPARSSLFFVHHHVRHWPKASHSGSSHLATKRIVSPTRQSDHTAI